MNVCMHIFMLMYSGIMYSSYVTDDLPTVEDEPTDGTVETVAIADIYFDFNELNE
jgi:hypothetical protein